MNTKNLISSLMVLGLVTGAASALADDSTPVKPDQQTVKQDVQKVREDRKEIKAANESIVKDKAAGNTEQLKKDRQARREAVRAKHADKAKLRQDRKELKGEAKKQ